MSFETSIDILYSYARERRGCTRVINALIKRIEDKAYAAEEMDGQLLAQVIISFNLCGHKGKAFNRFVAASRMNDKVVDAHTKMLVEQAIT